MVDTRGAYAHGVELADDVRRLAPDKPVRWVVNTHEHFDHVLGNLAFEDARIHAHENAAARMVDACDRIKDAIRADPSLDPSVPSTARALEAVLATDSASRRDVLVGGRDRPRRPDRRARLPGTRTHRRATSRSGCRTPTWCSPAT